MLIYMKPSQNAFDLIMSEEGDKLQSYQDSGGVWTIGYGHTGPEVHANMIITQTQASDYLNADVATKAVAPINRLVTVPLNQNQFDALVSFVFNIGEGHFASSTLLKLINEGNFLSASAQFLKWDYVGNTISEGLLNRRKREFTLFTAPVI